MNIACCAWMLVLLCAAGDPAREDIVVADFESVDYGPWTVEGAAFGPGPAKGTLAGQMAVSGYEGDRLVNSFYGGDGTTGTLTSPPFTLERGYLNFLVGGGKHPGETCVDLVVDGHAVRTATGPNDAPGGTERLDWHTWDLADFEGQTATIRIVDKATGGWGHINVDHIVMSDNKAPVPVVKTRTLTLDKPILNLPVKTGARKAWLTVEVDGKPVRQFEIELAPADPDFWVFTDVRPFLGKEATLRADGVVEDSTGLDLVETGDAIKGGQNLYEERLRPQFHFSSKRGWNNDPNGLVWHDGEYHLFYQHNPYGWAWGNMHWGHAVSPDLVHWEELGDALYPDAQGTMFSGSAVVDKTNTAGFGENALVCIYTAAGGTSRDSEGQPFTQCIAYSTDRGRTWTKYEGNPILAHIVGGNRDPKVFRHEPTDSWIMALYLDAFDFALFRSSDLKNWERLGDVAIPDTSECPEFFEIAVEGSDEKRWVFYGGNGRYLVGRFDGRAFTPESGPHTFHYGNSFYASQTYNNEPQGRRILIAWGQVDLPGMSFNQMMTFPIELTLRNTEEGLRLFAVPAREVESIRGQGRTIPEADVPAGTAYAERSREPVREDLLDIGLVFQPKDARTVTVLVRGIPVVYDAAKGELSCQGKAAPLAPVDGRISLRMLVDRVSLEIFANDGRVYMPMQAEFPDNAPTLEIRAEGGDIHVDPARINTLTSIWRKK